MIQGPILRSNRHRLVTFATSDDASPVFRLLSFGKTDFRRVMPETSSPFLTRLNQRIERNRSFNLHHLPRFRGGTTYQICGEGQYFLRFFLCSFFKNLRFTSENRLKVFFDFFQNSAIRVFKNPQFAVLSPFFALFGPQNGRFPDFSAFTHLIRCSKIVVLPLKNCFNARSLEMLASHRRRHFASEKLPF